jgi:hypothetical protein
MADQDFTSVLEEALTERDTQLQEATLPEINVGEAVPLREDLSDGLEYSEYGERTVLGATNDGIIGNKTTSIQTIDSEIEFKKSGVGTWAKAAVWTLQELKKWSRLNLAIDTTKLDDVYSNGMATIQRAGYIGHEKVVGQTGLLNADNVPVFNETTKKTIADMTASEVIAFILAVYNTAWKASDYRIAPDTIAMDAEDSMALASKFDANATIVGTDLMPLSALDKIYAALNKASNGTVTNINFVKVPTRLARGIKGKTRLVVYSNNDQYLNMSVQMPTLLDTRQRDMLAYEGGYMARFSGVKWIEPKSAVYGVYTTSS